MLFEITDFEFDVSHFRIQISDISDFRFEIFDFSSEVLYCGLQVAEPICRTHGGQQQLPKSL